MENETLLKNNNNNNDEENNNDSWWLVIRLLFLVVFITFGIAIIGSSLPELNNCKYMFSLWIFSVIFLNILFVVFFFEMTKVKMRHPTIEYGYMGFRSFN